MGDQRRDNAKDQLKSSNEWASHTKQRFYLVYKSDVITGFALDRRESDEALLL